MNIDELSLSVTFTATLGRPLICSAGADQLLTSDINPSVATRTYIFVYFCCCSLLVLFCYCLFVVVVVAVLFVVFVVVCFCVVC